MAWEGKKYKHDHSDGFDDYMKAIGMLNFKCSNHEF